MAIDLVATLRLNDQMSSSLKKVAGVAAIGFAGITAGAIVSINKFVEFDDAIRKAGAIAGASATELDALKESAIDLGASTSKNATEVASSMAEMAAKGFDANQTIAAMPGIIAAAEASGESLAVAADTVSSALNIWGLEAEKSSHVADVLAMAANNSAAGIGDMQLAFKYAGAPAAALGIGMEETAAAIGLMTDSGIDGSSAGTSLRAALLALNSPANAQAKIMDSLGFSMQDAQGNTKGLSEMIRDMTIATEGMSEADKVATLSKLVGTEAVSGYLALMNAGPDEIDKMTESLINSGGASQETADKMMGGIGGAIERMGGSIDSFMLRVGEAFSENVTAAADFIAAIDTDKVVENIKGVIEKVTEIASSFRDNWPAIKEAVIGITTAILAFKLGMMGLAIVQTVTTLIAAYRAGTLVATATQLGFNAAMWLSPTTWVIAGIAALIGIGVMLYRNWDTVTAKTKELWESVGGLEGAMAIILGPIGFLINAAKDLAKNWDSTKSVWENVWGSIQRSAATSVNAVIGLINKMIETINRIPGVNIPIIAKVDWGQATQPTAPAEAVGAYTPAVNSSSSGSSSAPKSISSGYAGFQPLSSRYHGIDYVPSNQYPISAHKGEAVLNASDAKQWREGKSGGGSVTVSGNTFNVRKESDIDSIAEQLYRKIYAAGEAGA